MYYRRPLVWRGVPARGAEIRPGFFCTAAASIAENRFDVQLNSCAFYGILLICNQEVAHEH